MHALFQHSWQKTAACAFQAGGSEVVWIKKVRVEQGSASMHPHRRLLHWLTAQWSGKQPFRVSPAFFFCFCLCGFGSRRRARDHLFWRWVCPGTQCVPQNPPPPPPPPLREPVSSPLWLTGLRRGRGNSFGFLNDFPRLCTWK